MQKTLKSNTLKTSQICWICRYLGHKTHEESERVKLEQVVDKIYPPYTKNFDKDKTKIGNILKKCVNVADQIALSDTEWATKDAKLTPEALKMAEEKATANDGNRSVDPKKNMAAEDAEYVRKFKKEFDDIANGTKWRMAGDAFGAFDDASRAWQKVTFSNWFEETVKLYASIFGGISPYLVFEDVEQRVQLFLGENHGTSGRDVSKERIKAAAKKELKSSNLIYLNF